MKWIIWKIANLILQSGCNDPIESHNLILYKMDTVVSPSWESSGPLSPLPKIHHPKCFFCRQITLLRVIPTLAFQVIYSDIHFYILPKSLSDIYSDILSGISSSILSGIYIYGVLSGIFSGNLCGIVSRIYFGILCGIYSGSLSGIYSGSLSGIYSGIPSGR